MIRRVPIKCGLIALWCLAAAGCARVTDEAAKDAATGEEAATVQLPAAAAPGLSVAAEARTPAAAPLAAVAPIAVRNPVSIDDQPTMNVQLPLPSASAADLPPATVERPVIEPVVPGTREPEHASGVAASSVASPLADETLDLASLLTRLRKTKAISLRTKLAVRNESDDLLERFRAYHAEHGTATLAELRQSYDSLFLKLHSLLEDADPPLARDIGRSRAAIWAILADPMKFGASASMLSTRGVPPA